MLDGWRGKRINTNSMKITAAYALLIIGVPAWAGLIVGMILAFPVVFVLRRFTKKEIADYYFCEAMQGLATSVAGAYLFHLFGLSAGIVALLIMAVWMTIYFVSCHQVFRGWASWMVGLAVGWFALVKILFTQ